MSEPLIRLENALTLIVKEAIGEVGKPVESARHEALSKELFEALESLRELGTTSPEATDAAILQNAEWLDKVAKRMAELRDEKYLELHIRRSGRDPELRQRIQERWKGIQAGEDFSDGAMTADELGDYFDEQVRELQDQGRGQGDSGLAQGPSEQRSAEGGHEGVPKGPDS